MKEYSIKAADAGKRLDAFLMERESMPRGAFMKALRTNKIKVNRKKREASYRLAKGDLVQSYILREEKRRPFSIVYEDAYVIIAEKPAGILCMGDGDTFLHRVEAYLRSKGERAFPVHRLDFNTRGLMMYAKGESTLAALSRLIRERAIKKSYLLVAEGIFRKKRGRMTQYLFKDAGKKQVYVTDEPVKGAKTAILDYEVKEERGGLSLVECILHTGRTHQIRAQMAHAGHPPCGR
ncbi:MAG: RluA family pseudouridine synthase [Dialister sp.]|nr:RluA family pseudouridine synthase [Dialister sp.]